MCLTTFFIIVLSAAAVIVVEVTASSQLQDGSHDLEEAQDYGNGGTEMGGEAGP